MTYGFRPATKLGSLDHLKAGFAALVVKGILKFQCANPNSGAPSLSHSKIDALYSWSQEPGPAYLILRVAGYWLASFAGGYP